MRDSTVVFKQDEIDSDGEIPAPFCYMKSKVALGLNQNVYGAQKDETERKSIPDVQQPEPIEEKSPGSEKSQRTEEYANEDMAQAPSGFMKKAGDQPNLFNPNDDDFISKVNKPMKPLTRD